MTCLMTLETINLCDIGGGPHGAHEVEKIVDLNVKPLLLVEIVKS